MIGFQANVRTVVLAIASIRGEFTDAKIVVLAIVNMVKENNDVRIVMADKLAYIRKWQIGVQFVTRTATLDIYSEAE